ncbi:glycerophosphodiester phosphodiesterase [Sporosarcina sp. ACRSL]|uniref:glycerophosphodiester phosphodiesterase n=1 Tax=Sporosarcina sp. ACRSL TaxID=2918215 RepID=UPI001EF55634|nr:glycerophosphodiester phosphodiesterase family protein [Sporosarcina sp. ACRSL]
MYKPTVFAHRGASGTCFENTISAFEEAARQKADGIEIDIQLTEDGVPVVIHDVDLNRIAGIRKSVSSIHSSELKDIKIGKKFFRSFIGHHIPTLRETVSFCEMKQLALNIELKETVSEKPESLLGIIDMALMLDNVHLSSFDPDILEKAKLLQSSIETALLVKKKTTDWSRLDTYTFVDGFHFHKRLHREPYISALIGSGKKLRVYGVTGYEEIVIQAPSCIDGWITDYPSRFKK